MGTRESRPDLSTLVQPARAATANVPICVITVVEGVDQGRQFDLDGKATRVLVGQSPACSIRLSDPEVSRRHASLDGGEWPLRLTDVGSTNGTFVNGVKVMDAHLFGTETIRLGATTLKLALLESQRTVPLSGSESFGRLLGGSVEMKRLYALCERLASTSVPVIIEGETGTGKEVLAEAIHAAGPRANGPFMVFDCTQVMGNLVESELFGHERGSFTGAVGTRKGIFEQADGGTLFIDEIGDLELPLQSKLLRAIQRGEIRRVGGDRWIPLDVRILAATRRDLDREVQAGRFRDDLFFRLAVGRIELPPLRRRRGDVGLLASAFWRELGGEGLLPYDVLCRWEAYEWPGNVRELRNEVARRAALGDLAELDRAGRDPEPGPRDVLEEILRMDLPLGRARERLVADFERRYIERVVSQHGGNVSRAAEASGLAHRYFQILRARHAR